jgi:hypothetical protein
LKHLEKKVDVSNVRKWVMELIIAKYICWRKGKYNEIQCSYQTYRLYVVALIIESFVSYNKWEKGQFVYSGDNSTHEIIRQRKFQ